MPYYTIRFTWLTGNVMSTRRISTYREALDKLRDLRRNPAIYKAALRKHTTTTIVVRRFKKVKGK